MHIPGFASRQSLKANEALPPQASQYPDPKSRVAFLGMAQGMGRFVIDLMLAYGVIMVWYRYHAVSSYMVLGTCPSPMKKTRVIIFLMTVVK